MFLGFTSSPTNLKFAFFNTSSMSSFCLSDAKLNKVSVLALLNPENSNTLLTEAIFPMSKTLSFTLIPLLFASLIILFIYFYYEYKYLY